MSNQNTKLSSLSLAKNSFNEAALIEAEADFDRAKLAFARAKSSFDNASIALERASDALALVYSESKKAMQEQQVAIKVDLIRVLLSNDHAISIPVDLLKELDHFLREQISLKYRRPKDSQQSKLCDYEELYGKFESMYGAYLVSS